MTTRIEAGEHLSAEYVLSNRLPSGEEAARRPSVRHDPGDPCRAVLGGSACLLNRSAHCTYSRKPGRFNGAHLRLGVLEDRFQSEAVTSPSGVTQVTLSRNSRRRHG